MQVPAYSYVGVEAGSFETEPPTEYYDSRWCKVCMRVLALTAIAGAAYSALSQPGLARAAESTTEQAPAPPAGSHAPPVGAAAGRAPAAQTYHGCTASAAAGAASVQAWSTEHRAWCCLHALVGCPLTGEADGAFDCRIGSVSMWAPGKATWCCMKDGLGCPTSAAEEKRNASTSSS